MSKLTLKQKRFVEALPTAKSQAEAARLAGYSDASEAAKVRASELVTNSNVIQAIEAQNEKIQAENSITQAEIAKYHREAIELARVQSNSSALTQAAQNLAKLGGLIVDKSKNENIDVTSATNADLIERAYKLIEGLR